MADSYSILKKYVCLKQYVLIKVSKIIIYHPAICNCILWKEEMLRWKVNFCNHLWLRHSSFVSVRRPIDYALAKLVDEICCVECFLPEYFIFHYSLCNSQLFSTSNSLVWLFNICVHIYIYVLSAFYMYALYVTLYFWFTFTVNLWSLSFCDLKKVFDQIYRNVSKNKYFLYLNCCIPANIHTLCI